MIRRFLPELALLFALGAAGGANALTVDCHVEPGTPQGYDLEAWVYASSLDAMSYDRVGYEVYWSWTDNQGPQFYTWGPYLFWLADKLSEGSGYNMPEGWIWATQMDAGAVLINGIYADWSTQTYCSPVYWG